MARKRLEYFTDAYDSIREAIAPSHNGIHKVESRIDKAVNTIEKAFDRGSRKAAKKVERATEKLEDLNPRKKTRFPWFFVAFALAAGVVAYLVRRNPEKVEEMGESISRTVRQAVPVTGGIGMAERKSPGRASTTGRVNVYYTPEGSQRYRTMSEHQGPGTTPSGTVGQQGATRPTATGQTSTSGMGQTGSTSGSYTPGMQRATSDMETTQPSTRRQTSTQKDSGKDDLEIVEGIGPKISKLLHDNGIHSYQQLADADPAELDRVLKGAGMTMANPSTWPAQARMALNGEWDALRALQDQIHNGVRKD